MLVYVQIFGSSVNQTLGIDVRADETIGEVQRRILLLNSDIVIRRCIFAGKQLDDLSKTIAQYDVHKESTLQVFAGSKKEAASAAEESEEKESSRSDEAAANHAAAASSVPAAATTAIAVAPVATALDATDDALPAMNTRPFMIRTPTDERIQYGDILVVKLISAKSLIAVDWNGTSDPYCVLAVDKQSSRSSMVKKNLNPAWHETFMFHIDLEGPASVHHAGKTIEEVALLEKANAAAKSDSLAVPQSGLRARSESFLRLKKKSSVPPPSARHLSIMCFDHDYIRHDETLGWFEIALDDIPRDTYIERSYPLQGVKSGEVTLSLQRCTLTSPQMKAVLRSLVALGRPIKQSDLALKCVSLQQLLGREPYISVPGSDEKRAAARKKGEALPPSSPTAFGGQSIQYIPALSHLASLIVNPASRFSAVNTRTLRKILFILASQQVVDLKEDLPTRYLWFTNLNSTHLSPSNFFLTLRKHLPNRIKRVLIPSSSRSGCMFVWFKRTEDAVLALLTVLDMRPIRACFGQQFEPTADQMLFNALKCGILNIAGPFASPNANTEAKPGEALILAAESDALPPPIGGAAPGTNVTSPSQQLARQNSNCINDAPVQKGKSELAWTSYWVFVTPPDHVAGKPAVLHALRRTSDFNASNPSASKWSFRVELMPSKCVIVRSGAWSIEVIMLDQQSQSESAPVAPINEEEEQKALPPMSPVLGRKLTIPIKPLTHSTFYIRAHSTEQVDEWLHLLKVLRSGDPLSPSRGPIENLAPLDGGLATPATPLATPMTPSASPPLIPVTLGEEAQTRVFCTSCNSTKSVLDIYTLDAAMDVTPTHPQPTPNPTTTAPVKPLNSSPPKLNLREDSSSPSPSPSRSTNGSSAPPSPNLQPSPTSIMQFTISACRDCLVALIRERMARGAFDSLSAEFSVQDVQDLLPRDLFLEYLDRSAEHLVDTNPRKYVRCPKCACPLEMENHTWSSKGEQFLIGLRGLDKQPLDDAAKAFFLANRFLCRGCRTDFCRACKAYPFHPGYSCAEYTEYLAAPKCRYCAAVVTSRTRLVDPPSRAFAEVCNSAECKEKVAQACCVVKACGHPCPGARDELDCPPCMHPECDARDPKAETAEDMCSICYTEELGQAPIVKLTCGHIFHVGCVRARLNAKWSGTRITFEFIRCPLCNVKMQHLLLTDLLRPFFHLENQVRVMALQRLEFESLMDHVDIITPEGRFYQDPQGFALDHFMFYQCYECQEPYFAGARACGAAGAGDEIKREELICGGCQKIASFDSCPTHGTSFLIFKCRFCCSFSTFFCFGKTHMCESCHDGSVWPQLCTSAGVNLKKWNEYTNCPGLKERVAAVCANESLTAEEIEKQLSTMYCDPSQCPIGVRHPPGGFEFGFGCGQCKPSDQKNSELDRLKKEEDEKLKHLLREGAKEVRRWKIDDEGVFVKPLPSVAPASCSDDVLAWEEIDDLAPALQPQPQPISFSLHDEAESALVPSPQPVAADGASSSSAVPSAVRPRVLVVEDSASLRKLLRSLLQRLGCEVHDVENGLLAVKEFAPHATEAWHGDNLAGAQESAPLEPHPIHCDYDLVTMDTAMPVMDGHVATRNLRRLGVTIPIVAVTGHALQEDIEAFLRAGADQVVLQPVNRRDLQAALAKHLPEFTFKWTPNAQSTEAGASEEKVEDSPLQPVSFSLHDEAVSASGLRPSVFASQTRSSTSVGDILVRHSLHADGDDLELQRINADGDILPVTLADAATNQWVHVTSKRAISYGCHLFQFKIVAMPPTLQHAASESHGWHTAQMMLGVCAEDAQVPQASALDASNSSLPLGAAFVKSTAGFTSNGCRVLADGALSAPLPQCSWRAGDVIALLVDLDQPGGVCVSFYHNGFEVRQHACLNRRLHAKHNHVRLVASFRGAGFVVSLTDCNFLDRALYRFDVTNDVPADQRLPRGVAKIAPLPQQDASKNQLRWLPLIQSAEVIDVPGDGAGDNAVEEKEEEKEDAEDDEDEYVDLGEGHHDPLTLRLLTGTPFCVLDGLEARYGPGAAGQVINCQADVTLPIWGESEMSYFELTVLDRGIGGYIGIGIAPPGYPTHRMPGWDEPSYGWHGDDGRVFGCGSNGLGKAYGPVWKVGDVIGCGIDRRKREIFYTRNGARLPTAFKDVDLAIKWLPTIGMHSEGEHVRVNFAGPFAWKFLERFPFRVKKAERAAAGPNQDARANVFRALNKADRPQPQRLDLGGLFAHRRAPGPDRAAAARARSISPERPPEPRIPGFLLRAAMAREQERAARAEARKKQAPVNGGGWKKNKHGQWVEEHLISDNDDDDAEQPAAANAAAAAGAAAAPLRRVHGLIAPPRRFGLAEERKQEEEEEVPEEFKEREFPPGPWSCMLCTYINPELVLMCAMCETPRNAAPPPPVARPPPPPPPPAEQAAAAAAPALEAHPPPPPPAEEANPPPPPREAVPPPPPAAEAVAQPAPVVLAPAPDDGLVAPPVIFAAPVPPPVVERPMHQPQALGAFPPIAIAQFAPPLRSQMNKQQGAAAAGSNDRPKGRLLDNHELALLPTGLLRSLSNPSDPDEEDAKAVANAEAQLARQRAQRAAEQERADRLAEERVEFDGVNAKPLVLELQGSAALTLQIPIALAPRGNAGMERFAVQAKESLKAYTIVLDLMLPKDQLNPPPPAPANKDLRYFPLFDTFASSSVPANDPMSTKAWFVHPTGVVGPIGNSLRKEPDPVLQPATWSRVVLIVDSIRDRYETWIDGVQCVKTMERFGQLGDKIRRLEILNSKEGQKQLRLFSGQTDVRKNDAELLKLKRIRQVQFYARALSAGEIWKISGSGGATGLLTGNPLSGFFSALALQTIPPVPEGSPIFGSSMSAALDKPASKAYFFGGATPRDPSKKPLDTVYMCDMRKKPILLTKLDTVSPYPRAYASSVFYRGSVYIFGGRAEIGDRACNTLVVFTPATNTWKLREYSATDVPPMAGHAAVVFGDAMYVVGADASVSPNGPTPELSLFQYRFSTDTWRQVEIVANAKQAAAQTAEEPAAAASSSSSSASALPPPKPRHTSKGIWQPCVGTYGHTIVCFGGCNSLFGKKARFAGKGLAGEFVLDAESLCTDHPTATWRNLLSPVAVGRARGPPEATHIYAAGGMMHVGEELLFYGGMSSAVQSTLYAYSTVTHKWRAVALSPLVAPVARSHHTTVFDPITGHMLLVGGQDQQQRPVLASQFIAFKNAAL